MDDPSNVATPTPPPRSSFAATGADGSAPPLHLPDPTCRREPKRAASHQRREWPSTYIVNMIGIFVDICKHNIVLFINNIIAK